MGTLLTLIFSIAGIIAWTHSGAPIAGWVCFGLAVASWKWLRRRGDEEQLVAWLFFFALLGGAWTVIEGIAQRLS